MLARRAAQSLCRQSRLMTPAASRAPATPFSSLQQHRYKSTLPFGSQDNVSNPDHRDESHNRPAADCLQKIPDFTDAKAAYEAKTNMELFRALIVFQLCRIPFIVEHSETLLRVSRKILGGTLTDALLKATMFGHFCAGEDEKGIQPVLLKMQKSGIGSILDYAHEDDGESNESPPPLSADAVFQEANNQVRVYDYESEHQCDKHVGTFKKCINAVKNLDADGYAAVKVTALGPPKLLEKMSRAVREVKILFSKFDKDNDGFISRDEFEQGFRFFFREDTETELAEMFELLDPNHTGRVDFITWSMLLSPSDLPRITSKCRDVGPLAMASPTDEEVELIQAMFNRGHELAREAAKCGTRLLIDAEQYRFQPAIDNLVLDLQRNFNAAEKTDKPIIYNTYQCYLKDTAEQLPMDMERSERHSYHFGAKLVRGAYMEGERALAESLGYESPIHETIEDTHACYNNAVEYLMRQSTQSGDRKVEMMLASHNQKSIEKAIKVMGDLDIDPLTSTICFAQLYGMSDNLTYNLGQNGFRSYKYVPYGLVGEVMPYLVRRARENSAIAGGADKELTMIRAELKRRVGFA